MKFIKNNLMTA